LLPRRITEAKSSGPPERRRRRDRLRRSRMVKLQMDSAIDPTPEQTEKVSFP